MRTTRACCATWRARAVSRCWSPSAAPKRCALAREYQPSAISLDIFLPDMLGWTVLARLKQDSDTRHIPVQIVTIEEERHHSIERGAFSYLAKPATTETIDARARTHQGLHVAAHEAPAGRRGRRRRAHEHRGADPPRRRRDRRPSAPARRRSKPCRATQYDCVVLDLRLPDMSGFDLLDRIQDEPRCASCRSSCSPARTSAPRKTRAFERVGQERRRSRASSRPSACSTRRRCSCTA